MSSSRVTAQELDQAAELAQRLVPRRRSERTVTGKHHRGGPLDSEGLKNISIATYERVMPGTPKNIDDYLSRVTPAQRIALQALRKQIRAIVPGAEECISYSMPAFREPGGPVFAGFLATKQGWSYFPFSGSTLDSVAAALSSVAARNRASTSTLKRAALNRSCAS